MNLRSKLCCVVVVAFSALAGAEERVVRSTGTEAPDAWDVKPFYGQKLYLYGFGGDAADRKAYEAMPEKAMFRNVWFGIPGELRAGDLWHGPSADTNAIVRIGDSAVKDKVWKGKRPIRITDMLATPTWKGRWEYCRQFMNDHPTALASFGLIGARPAYYLPETADTHRDDFVIWKWDNPRFAGFAAFDEYDADILSLRWMVKNTADPEIRARLNREYPPFTDDISNIRKWTDLNYRKLKSYCFKVADLTGLWSIALMTGHDIARQGVKYLRYEAEHGSTAAPWRIGGMYARGASRQFDIPLGWYGACFTYNSATPDGRRSPGQAAWPNPEHPEQKPHFGCSRSLAKRNLAYGAFIGCSSLCMEGGARLMYAADGKGWTLSPFGEDMEKIFEWAHATDRGKSFTPVALLVSLDENMTRNLHFPYAKDIFSQGAFWQTLVPTRMKDYNTCTDMAKGFEGCLWNSSFGELCDVIASDAGQGDDKVAEVLSGYKAAILVGAFDARFFKSGVLDRYVRGGGTLFCSCDQVTDGFVPAELAGVSFGDAAVKGAGELGEGYSFLKARPLAAKPLWTDANGTVVAWANDLGKGRVVTVAAWRMLPDELKSRADWWEGKVRRMVSGELEFPIIRKVLRTLQDELMPVTVEGDIQWGVNRTKTGWLVWLLNNKGVTKFAGEPERLDPAAAAKVTVTLKATGERKDVTVGPGDWATVTFADAPALPKPREIALSDWEFSHDRRAWTPVQVPHDWAIGEPFDINVDAQDVAVVEDGESEVSRRIGRTGALPWIGEGWYRRHLTIPEGVRAAELWFDGAMANAEVFANGAPIGGWRYGYTPFVVKLPKAREIDLLVHLRTMPQSSRWYPGAGLYRKVTLRLDPQYRVEDVFVRTERIEDGRAHMRVSGPNGDRTFVVENPRLWTPEDPYLYTLEPEGIRYGIRTVGWKDGTFRLNGKVRKFRGVCLHHDLGSVGTAFNPAAFRRQVRLLKEIGCDAIRTAHNIPCSEQLDICDEMGMMVMAESFDEWQKRKCRYGYHDDFTDWWRADLEALVRFHRNHPSVVMWSIGNEIPAQGSPETTQITRAMTGLLHWFDPTRPVTQGHSSMPYAIEAGGVQAMDIPGVTYRLRFYDQLHAASKYGGVLGAETASTMSTRGWYAFPDEAGVDVRHPETMQSSSYDVECGSWSNLPDDDWAVQDDNPWTMGEFVWTGFDYLGEPAPYDDDRSRSSYFGIYDLAGLPKDRAYLYRARWRTDAPTLHVLPHWTWPDRVGQVTPVYVYTSYPEAELFVNGKSQGRKTFDKSSRLDRYRLRWRDVVYEPGELKVVAYGKDGKAAATKVVRTAGAPHRLVLTPDRTRLEGARDLAFVTVDIVDRDGNLCPHAANRVNFRVSGAGRFHSACNGDATDLDTLSQPTMKAFNGRLVAVIAADAVQAGEIVLTAAAEGVGNATVILRNEPPADSMRSSML